MGNPRIPNLSAVTSISGGDLVVVYTQSNGDARKISVTNFLAFFEQNFASPDLEVILSSPITGFNQVLGEQTEDVWLQLSPLGTLASGTITLPPVASAFDGQMILVTTAQIITALTVAGNGATVSGAPTTMGAGASFTLRYSKTLTTWFAIQSGGGSISTFSQITLTNQVATILDLNGNAILALATDYVDPTPANLRHLVITNSDGGTPTLTAGGADATIPIGITPLGDGDLILSTNGGANLTLGGLDGDIDIGSVGLNGVVTIGADGASGAIDISTLSGPIAITAGDEVAINAQNAISIGAGALVTIVSTGVISDAQLEAPTVKTTAVTVAALGSAATAGVGARGFVTDASTTLLLGLGTGPVLGSGANKVPVYSDGAIWLYG
jgi:hypothetical protein